MKSRITTAILAFFLGGLGIHRFYLGQGGLGLVYLIFSLTLIPALIGLIDCIVFLTMSDAAFNAKYNLPPVIHVNMPGYQQQHQPQNTQNFNKTEEIEKLYSLLEKNIITQEDFERKKAELLK